MLEAVIALYADVTALYYDVIALYADVTSLYYDVTALYYDVTDRLSPPQPWSTGAGQTWSPSWAPTSTTLSPSPSGTARSTQPSETTRYVETTPQTQPQRRGKRRRGRFERVGTLDCRIHFLYFKPTRHESSLSMPNSPQESVKNPMKWCA